MPTITQLHKIPIMGKKFWNDIGTKLKKKVEEELLKGHMMNDTSNWQYSRQYAKYKANRFQRFTGRKGKRTFTTIGGSPTRTDINLTSGGSRLKGIRGSLLSTDVSKVTMIATGELIRGLHIQNTTDSSLTMSYQSKDANKIRGNQRWQYDVVGLNEALRNWVRYQMLLKIDKNMRQHIKTKEIIKIS